MRRQFDSDPRHKIKMRVSYNGITTGCQSADRGSTPLTRSESYSATPEDDESRVRLGHRLHYINYIKC